MKIYGFTLIELVSLDLTLVHRTVLNKIRHEILIKNNDVLPVEVQEILTEVHSNVMEELSKRDGF